MILKSWISISNAGSVVDLLHIQKHNNWVCYCRYVRPIAPFFIESYLANLKWFFVLPFNHQVSLILLQRTTSSYTYFKHFSTQTKEHLTRQFIHYVKGHILKDILIEIWLDLLALDSSITVFANNVQCSRLNSTGWPNNLLNFF